MVDSDVNPAIRSAVLQPGRTVRPPKARVTRGARPGSAKRLRRLLGLGVPGILLGVVCALAAQRPGFYVERLRAAEPTDQNRLSKEFVAATIQLVSAMQNESAWSANFPEVQINAFLAEELRGEQAETALPSGVSDPRVALVGDQASIGFRSRHGPVALIVHFAFRAWVPKPNVLAVELVGARVGQLPLPTTFARRVVERLADVYDVTVTWKRNGRNLVALLAFPRGQRDVVLQQIELYPGGLRLKGINGRFADPQAGGPASVP